MTVLLADIPTGNILDFIFLICYNVMVFGDVSKWS